jgi:hypothetical protein
MDKKRSLIRCTECGDILTSKKIVWLELSNSDGNYYREIPKGHVSQGGFPFGTTCSKKVLKNDGKRN